LNPWPAKYPSDVSALEFGVAHNGHGSCGDLGLGEFSQPEEVF